MGVIGIIVHRMEQELTEVVLLSSHTRRTVLALRLRSAAVAVSLAINSHVGICVLVWEAEKAYLVVFRHRFPVVDQDRFQDLWHRELHVWFLVMFILRKTARSVRYRPA